MEHTQSQIADDICSVYSHFDRVGNDGSINGQPSAVTYAEALAKLNQTEAALRESQERLQLIMQGSRDGFWDWSIDNNKCYVSDRWKEMRGIAIDQAIPDVIAVWKDSIHRDDRDRVLRALQAHLDRQSATFNEEYRILRRDGSSVWILDRAQAMWDDDNRPVRMAGSQTDITHLKRTEEALRQSELIYRMLADTMPQMFWITRADGYHEYYNQRWYDFTGTRAGDTDGEGWQNILHPDDIDRTVAVWQESLTTGKPYNIEYRMRRASDGEYRWQIGRALPLRDQDGTILKWFGSCTDIHDQRLAIEERAQALERERAARIEQEKANRIKDEFLAILSHELRSPLNPILGWIKLLRTRKLKEAQVEQALETIDRNAKLQAQLIEDLLDVSRILRGKLRMTLAPVDLNSVIGAAIETVHLTAQAKNIQIHTHLDPTMGRICGDFNRLQQVVWNLLSNAVKFTPESGEITVESGVDGYWAKIVVHDTGKGIAPEFVPYVFEQFRQADSSTTRQFGGLGLGLAIVRHIIEMHNGTISVESLGENQGATFTVRLPLIESVPAPVIPARPTPVAQLSLRGLRILVVDDEPDARQLMSFLLSEYGAQVIVAESAQDALAQLRQATPDILISDLGMPDLDGYDLIRQVRRQNALLPAIAVTAYAREEDRTAALSAGFQAHLTKPIELTELVKTIVTLIEQCQPSN